MPPPVAGGERRKGDAAQPDAGQAGIIRKAMLRHSLSLRDVCVLIITLLALFYTLNCAADIVLPFVFAMVVNLLMIAPMRFLHGRLRLPKPIAALLLIIAMFVIVAGIGTAISVPAAAWLTKVPQSLPALQDKLAFLQGPIESLQRGYYRVISLVSSSSHHHVSAAAAASSSASNSAETLRLWGSSVLVGTRAFMGELFTMLLMLFFLMTEGDSLLRRIVEIMPTYSDKRRLVQITTQIERNVSLYLATITIMNLLVGLLNLLQCWLTGMPNPLLWGVLAFLLNYVPIIGPLTGVVVYFCVALISFPSFLLALLPPAIYLCIHIMEGETITPMLLAKRFTLNPVLVMASLLFWDWMWGIGGAFLSVPMLAVFKIFCDHIEALTPIGHVLGGPVRPRSLRTIGDPVSGSTANTAL
ncbi:transporter [Swaminathania salitolerans LMG 21291]|uniref:AI-2E family transporter n=2 Tax=Swaminathania salitolerans TaxID=182838 RepID=A0A511BQX7_9PROT|nr:transporter [Swaminathania salitolerans LMG 21291]GEL02747.1 AI-2E family transporter [Swaminathania salitolerans]